MTLRAHQSLISATRGIIVCTKVWEYFDKWFRELFTILEATTASVHKNGDSWIDGLDFRRNIVILGTICPRKCEFVDRWGDDGDNLCRRLDYSGRSLSNASIKNQRRMSRLIGYDVQTGLQTGLSSADPPN